MKLFPTLKSRFLTPHLQLSRPAGVCRVSFWPGDPEVSVLRSASAGARTKWRPHDPSEPPPDEAALDAVAAEKLKSNSGAHIGVLLEPLAVGLAQFVDETSRGGDFMERLAEDEPGLDLEELFNRWIEAASGFRR